MINSKHLGFLVFAFTMVIFFIIPEYEGIQKPFRLMLCCSFPVIYFALLLKKEIRYRTLYPLGWCHPAISSNGHPGYPYNLFCQRLLLPVWPV